MNPSNPERSATLRAGVVGLGMIGGGVATSLARSGRVPVVYDIRPEAAELPGSPELASSPAEVAARSDIVMLAVVDAEQALEVISGRTGLLSAAHPGLTIVLLSTVDLPTVRKLATLSAEHGAGFLDCGVTPGDKAAENGMVAMVGGDEATFSHAAPVLADFSKAVVHCGPVGAGMATKLARNVVTYGSWRAVAEAAALASSAGVEPHVLMDVITTADPSGSTLLMLLNMQQQGDADALARQIGPLMDKDLAAAQQLASNQKIDLPLVDAARRHAHTTLAPGGRQEGAVTPPTDGLRLMDEVYGTGFSEGITEQEGAFMNETVDHLFGQIWSRPGLSIRDRRLLVIGATAAMGNADLIQTQVRGALANQELTTEQLDEAVLHLAYYVGWGKATGVHRGVSAAIADHAAAERPRHED